MHSMRAVIIMSLLCSADCLFMTLTHVPEVSSLLWFLHVAHSRTSKGHLHVAWGANAGCHQQERKRSHLLLAGYQSWFYNLITGMRFTDRQWSSYEVGKCFDRRTASPSPGGVFGDFPNSGKVIRTSCLT